MRYVIFQRDFYMRTSWLKALILTSALPVLASAHTASPYILPDVFDTSSANSVSFQSSITLEKFFVPSFNFKTNYVISTPSGQQKNLAAAAALKKFNVAEFDLNEDGTYRIRTQNATGNPSKYALVDGRWLRVRANRMPMQNPNQANKPAETAKTEQLPAAPANNQPPRFVSEDQLPKNAQVIEVTNHLIAESFVTKGKPSAIPAASNKGFEVKLLSHPGELYAGEALKAQVLFDGKPIPNLEIDVFKGADSYDLNAQREQPHTKTNNKGEVEIKFEKTGIYLITTAYPEANPDATKKPASDIYTYGLTVEVAE